MPTAIPTVPSHSSNVPESPATKALRMQLEEAQRAAAPQQPSGAPAPKAKVPATTTRIGLRGMTQQPSGDIGSIFREQDAARARMLAAQRQGLGINGAAPASGYYGIDPTTGKPIQMGGLFKAPIARLFGGTDEANWADKLAWWVGGRPFYPTTGGAQGNPMPMPGPDSASATPYPIPGGPYTPEMPTSYPTDGLGMGINIPGLTLDWTGLYPEARI